MKINKQFDLKDGVHTLQLLDDNTLACLDVSNSFRTFDLDEFKLIDGFKSKLPSNIPYVNNMAISPDGSHLSFYNKELKEVSIFDRSSRKFKHSIKNHPGGVETVTFTQDSKYLITGGMEGRLYMWSVSTGQKVDTLSHHSDAVLAISSNDTGRWIATAGYDKVIKVFNRSFRKNHYKLISHKEPVTTVSFLTEQRLLSTDKEGTILIWDIVKSKVIARLPKFDSHITAVCVDKEEDFLFVAGIGGMVGLYHLKEERLLKIDFLKQLAGVTQMQYCDEKNLLVFGLSNGHIPIYQLNSQNETFTELMQKKDFHGCYTMVEDNPLLCYSKEYESLEKLFERVYEHAKKLLRADKKAEAKELLKNFTASSEKRLIVQKLFNDFTLFSSFNNAIKGRKYMMAYSLAAEYPTLKETPEYEKMEEEWSKVLIVVRKIINEKSSEEKIKQLFKPFMGVPGKNLIIKTLYTNRNVFTLFRKHLKEKDYFNAFKLASGHPFIEELEEYENLLKIGEMFQAKTQDTFNQGGYYDSVKLCDTLSCFPAQKEFAESLKGKANIYAETMKYYAEKQFAAVFNMIEEYPFLEDAKIAIDIEEDFLDHYEKAENYAAVGNVAALKKVMEKFSKIKSKQPSIYHLVKIAYWAQIEEGAKAKVPDSVLKDAFAKYEKFFGYDSMLEDLLSGIQQYRSLKVNFSTQQSKEHKGGLDALDTKIVEI
ncbi:WD40 repeat domain-containing protein [Campylobacterota bacterium]